MNNSLFWVIYFSIQGAIVGSFLNVVVDRLPKGLSLLGRSKCDGCNRKLSYLELVPIFSYLFLGGLSKCCKKKLSINYSLVELLTSVIFGILTFRFFSLASQGDSFQVVFWIGLIGLLTLAATTICIVIIDFKHKIIPDTLQIFFFLGALMLVFFQNDLTPDRIGQATLISLPILLLYLGTKGRGMGYGDIKLAFSLGLWLGFWNGVVGLYLAFIIGAIYGVVLMMLNKAGRKSHIAFGPFLLIGAWIAFFVGEFYMKLFFSFL